jgi:hypothetical protein
MHKNEKPSPPRVVNVDTVEDVTHVDGEPDAPRGLEIFRDNQTAKAPLRSPARKKQSNRIVFSHH